MKTQSLELWNILVLVWLGCTSSFAQTNNWSGQTNMSGKILEELGVPQWGVATNYVKPGLGINYMDIRSNGLPVVRCTPLVQYIAPVKGYTNMIRMVFLPVPWRYQMTLLDDNGNAVAKTKAGETLGRPLGTRPRISGRHHYISYDSSWNPNDMTFLPAFDLQEYFKIDQPGKYHFQLVIQGLTDTGPTNHVPLYFYVNAEIAIKKRETP